VFFLLSIILGGIWGSFANVCIHRIPLNQSVAVKRSYCPNCGKTIKWFDNIPLISFILLRGKCRDCNKKIGSQYFLVELLSVLSFLLIYYLFGISITSLLFAILSIFFIIIFFIDLKHFIIPNTLTFPLMAIGFIKSFDPNLNTSIFPNYLNSLLGGIIGYLIIWTIIYLYKKFRNIEGMGLGDAKLLSAIGFWFGWISLPFIIFISSLVALLVVAPSLVNKSKKMSSEIPFGPYIIIGCILFISFSNQIKYFII
jgi:leader peptidase (prepilin peptidase)/N-methyltransferase|tara:strand:+ start:184 stop:948 length:765 start_codon:yes stop_codon:yes gene_type:complete